MVSPIMESSIIACQSLARILRGQNRQVNVRRGIATHMGKLLHLGIRGARVGNLEGGREGGWESRRLPTPVSRLRACASAIDRVEWLRECAGSAESCASSHATDTAQQPLQTDYAESWLDSTTNSDAPSADSTISHTPMSWIKRTTIVSISLRSALVVLRTNQSRRKRHRWSCCWCGSRTRLSSWCRITLRGRCGLAIVGTLEPTSNRATDRIG